jgi:ABC-type glycerol-3-phosphate transport system substrate-binding protein
VSLRSAVAALSLAVTSKHPDQVMQVMEVVTSDEVQADLMKNASMISGLNNKAIQKNFAEDLSIVKGKNTEAIFKSKAAPYIQDSDYFSDIRKIVEKKYADYASGEKDINTALREVAEETNQLLASK